MDTNSNIDTTKIAQHWQTTSNEDFETMLDLYKTKRYHWALFFGHISVEKILKSLYVKKHQTHPPFTHNLYRLAELSNINISDEYSDWLFTITSYNINARYEDYKREFYKRCTKEYTEEWITKIKTLREWIEKML